MTPAPLLDPSDQVAIFLDFDGTLVQIAEHPDLAQVPANLRGTLQSVHDSLDGALALITGRSIASLDALLAPLHLPAAGVHGMEYRDVSGVVQAVAAPRFPDWARAELVAVAAIDAGLLLEDKVHGMALHYRGAPEMEQRVRDAVAAVAVRLGADFAVQDGKMVVELRPSCASKGTAVERFMANPPFAGRRPVFIGDDITDEDAFRAVNEMDGYSIRVGELGPGSAARYVLTDVEAVRDWLVPLANN